MSAESDVPPPGPAEGVVRAETLVVSAVQYTNMLVRLLKRSSHNKHTTEGENVFLMYNAGKKGAGK